MAVTTVSAFDTLVETERDVLRDSTTVGIVVVTTMGEVAIGIEFCARASSAHAEVRSKYVEIIVTVCSGMLPQ